MNSTFPSHADDELLLRLVDGDLSPAEARFVGNHLGVCSTCRCQLDEIRETLGDYLQFHDNVLKGSVSPPPLPWKRLDFQAAVRPRDARKTPRRFSMAPPRWLLATAAIGLIVLVVGRLEHPPTVKAGELLGKATKAERTAPARKRTIRIQTGTYHWDRPARLAEAPARALSPASADASRIRQLLESANYSWDDPLSVEAFTRWHDRVSDKRDQVDTFPAGGPPVSYVIHTTTAASPISDALLTLRAADLHAVACTLRLRAAGTIEMSEIPDEIPEPHVAPERLRQPRVHSEPQGITPARLAGPGDELMAVAALHRVGADLGEPVEVRRDGPNVLVNMTGLDPRRQEEVEQAMAGIGAVRLQSGEPARSDNAGVERRTPPQVDTVNPLLSELQGSVPGSTAEAGDLLIENTERIIERAYALRALARKFPQEDATLLTAPQTATLNGIIRDHEAVIAASVLAIRQCLAPILPAVGPTSQIADDSWQNLAQALLSDARRLDQALNATGTPDDSNGRKLRAAQALADIDQRMARLRILARP